jgi:hypothetical protein
MARDNFDFPSLTPGEFFHKKFPSGKVMVGWGRPGRSKFVQLDQAEIVEFLASAAAMVVTDDEAVKEALGQLAKTLTVIQRPLTFDQISVLAASNPAVGPRFAEIIGGEAAGDIDRAREILTRELRETA